MDFKNRIKKYVISQFELVNKDAKFKESKDYVLLDKKDNFFNHDDLLNLSMN